jgi:uncharacterized membrane protein (UPF0127 family)
MNFRFFTAIAASAFIFSACVTPLAQVEKKSVQPVYKDVFSFPDGHILDVRLAGNALKLVVANSPKAKSEGLSNKGEIPQDGMIFFFYERSILSFWMKEMRFPIDIVWIDGNKVIGIEKHVQIPVPYARVNELKIYNSNDVADIVVELAAGAADKLNIVPGSILELDTYQNLRTGENND